jgi:hypothetical protein
MHRRDGAVLDHLNEVPAMRLAQDRGLTRGLAVQKPIRTVGIEAQHPVTHRLQAHAADLSRLGAGAPVIDRRQRQKSSGLRAVLSPTRQAPQASGIVIASKRHWNRHGKPPRLPC